MIARGQAGQMLEQTRARVRKRVILRELHAVTAGKHHGISFSIDEKGVDVPELVIRSTAGLHPDSAEIRRLRAALQDSGRLDSLIEGLAARDLERRAKSARVVGALRLEDAVPWLAPLLASRESSVADAAARALGRIGGVRSAEALLQTILRSGPRRVLITELARAAPDLFVEVVLAGPQRPGVTPASALAAGLRGRQTAVTPLLNLLSGGNRRQRVVSCRALGWIGARTAIPLIALALRDREWRVRVSAAKALAVLRARTTLPEVETLLADRHFRVRIAAAHAVHRLQATW